MIIKYQNFVKMKKLNDLHVNSERLLSNEELLMLKGGKDSFNACTCLCYTVLETYGYFLSPDRDCVGGCRETFGSNVWGVCIN